jgi:transcriptional regulator with XRE-family HTH domain
MREDLGLTQAQLAAQLGVAVQTVGRWESYGPPKAETIERILKWAERTGYSGLAEFREILEQAKEYDPTDRSLALLNATLHEVTRKPAIEGVLLLPKLRSDLVAFLNDVDDLMKRIRKEAKEKR